MPLVVEQDLKLARLLAGLHGYLVGLDCFGIMCLFINLLLITFLPTFVVCHFLLGTAGGI
jgi:hypothetical protein